MTAGTTARIERWARLAGRGASHLAALVVVLALWEWLARAGVINSFLMPPPSQVGAAIVRLYVSEGTAYYHVFITLSEVLLGFGIGGGIGIALAVASTLSPAFNRYFTPYAVVLAVTPGLALTPIVITWFGFGISSKVALVAIVTFFPVFVNTLTGLTSVDQDRAEMFRALRAGVFQTFWKLQVPSALPLAMAGVKVGSTVALVGAIAAEFMQASAGIGLLMNRFSFQLDMASSIASLLSMSAMGLLIFGVIELLDNRAVYWRSDRRLAEVSRRKKAAWIAGQSTQQAGSERSATAPDIAAAEMFPNAHPPRSSRR